MLQTTISAATAPDAKAKKGFLKMRLFRSNPSSDRKGSLDSSVRSIDSESSKGSEQRRKSSIGRLLRKKPNSFDVPRDAVTTTTIPTRAKAGSVSNIVPPSNSKQGRLKKQQRDDFPRIDVSQAYQRDKQTGERVVDHTDMLHSLGLHDESDDLPRVPQFRNNGSQAPQTGEQLLSRLPMKLWLPIVDLFSPADRASLSLTCKALRQQLQSCETDLQLPGNESERVDFLLRLDSSLPKHLFCFACNLYHVRLNPGTETLRPTNMANPIFTCPYGATLAKRISRIRLTSNRALPFTFVQLCLRAHHFSPAHGISLDSLSRRYRDRDTKWTHTTRLAVVPSPPDNTPHLLLRVISTTFADGGLPPSGVRRLLYNPHESFHPYFSTCPHWRDGDLMSTVKCALSHIPIPVTGSGIDRVAKDLHTRYMTPGRGGASIVTLCSNCRPIRRCPDCPTEYMIEIKMAEDRDESDPRKRFKQALVVSRWSDLGDGRTPTGSPEWVALCDDNPHSPAHSAFSTATTTPATTTTTSAVSTPATEDDILEAIGGLGEDGEGGEEEEKSGKQPFSSVVVNNNSNNNEDYDFDLDDDDGDAIAAMRMPAPAAERKSLKPKFDSFAALGRRAINGVFESQFNADFIPGQRILNMNPRNERLGERGHNWY